MFNGMPQFKTTFNDNGTVTLSALCLITKKPHAVTVPEVGYRQWMTGNGNIQDVMPTVSVDDREFLITGFSPEGWAIMQKDLEAEEFDDEDDDDFVDQDEDLFNDDIFEDEDDFRMHKSMMRGR